MFRLSQPVFPSQSSCCLVKIPHMFELCILLCLFLNKVVNIHTHTHTIVLLLFWNLSGTIRMSRYQKGKNQEGKTNLDSLEQEIVSGSGILLGHMQVCTSSQITTPTSHHSVFYRPDALPGAQPTASKCTYIWLIMHFMFACYCTFISQFRDKSKLYL